MTREITLLTLITRAADLCVRALCPIHRSDRRARGTFSLGTDVRWRKNIKVDVLQQQPLLVVYNGHAKTKRDSSESCVEVKLLVNGF